METAAGTDLTPVLEVLQGISGQLDQIESALGDCFVAVCMISGVLLGCAIAFVFQRFWR